MTLGMSTSAFTLLHVVLSLIGIVAGMVVAAAMLGSTIANGWTALFLATTVLTSVTGTPTDAMKRGERCPGMPTTSRHR